MKDTTAVIVAAVAALGVAVLVAKVVGPPTSVRIESRVVDAGAIVPPALVSQVHAPLASRGRAIPPSIAAQADVRAAPWAPGIRLNTTERDGAWPEWRAHVEDLTTKDTRAYAIGDLLPHGSLLVGISTSAVDVLVADREIVRIYEGGGLKSWEDFEVAARPVGGPKRVRGPDPDFREAVTEAIDGLRSDDTAYVQAAIDALVEAGDPVVEMLIVESESLYPAARATYAVPSGTNREIVPEVQGDLIIAILERITGQTFGDPTIADPAERRFIIERWHRWWSD